MQFAFWRQLSDGPQTVEILSPTIIPTSRAGAKVMTGRFACYASLLHNELRPDIAREVVAPYGQFNSRAPSGKPETRPDPIERFMSNPMNLPGLSSEKSLIAAVLGPVWSSLTFRSRRMPRVARIRRSNPRPSVRALFQSRLDFAKAVLPRSPARWRRFSGPWSRCECVLGGVAEIRR